MNKEKLIRDGISFEFIKENCKTIGDLKKLTQDYNNLVKGGKD